ncbi:hypothetical protein COCON_G00048690 [Conger conger]|uniref:Uncharacterized protein n=1 Tax=Conger conger TaxID=82655 RepID=A0A9Q1DV25_CONCO|nr:hypothetical protein COCON_G00048690 [Conger conger]
MKDFALSLLSRGCGHVVQTQVDSQGGRIEVCFEPEDYFNWKSSQPVLRLSDSGRIRCGVEPAPPKTYSTRRGPLLLYSADMALPCKPEDASRKRRGYQNSVQQVELQLRTLTGAILAYDKKQTQDASNVIDAQPSLPSPMPPPVTQLSQTWYPPTSPCDPKEPAVEQENTEDLRSVDCLPASPDTGQRPCSDHSAQRQTGQCLRSKSVFYDHSKEQPLAPNPSPCDCEDETVFLLHPRPYTVPRGPLPPIPEGIVKNWGDTENQRVLRTGNVEDQDKSNKLWIVVDAPRVQMSPIAETGRTDWGLNSRNIGDRQEGPVLHDVTGCPGYIGAHGKCSATEAGEVGERPRPLKTAFVDSSWSCSRLSHVTYYGGHLSGGRLGISCVDRKVADPDIPFPTLHFPPVPSGPLLKSTPLIWSGPDKGCTGKKSVGPQGLEKQGGAVRLPPLCESNSSTGATGLTRPHSPGAPALRPPQSTEDPRHGRPQRELHRKMLLLPLLEHTQSQKADVLKQHGGSHDIPAADGKRGFCEEFGQDKEIVKTGHTNRRPSPTPAVEPKNRVNLDGLGLLEPGKEDISPLGMLPSLGGRKGPGKQSSMAIFRQDLSGPQDCDPDDLQTAVVRGILPVELREWQNVGTVIMGPDGEIIQLSFWGSAADTNDQKLLDDIARGQALNASELMQDQPWALLLQANGGTFVSDSFGGQAYMNQSALNKQDGFGREFPYGQQGAEESQGLYPISEDQCSLPKRPRGMGTGSEFSYHNTDLESEEGMEGTWDHQAGPLGLGQKRSKGLLGRGEEASSTHPSASALYTGGGNTTGGFLSNKQSAETTAGAMSGGRSQSGQDLGKTSMDADAKKAKRNRMEQQEEGDIRNWKVAEGEDPFGEMLTEAERKAKGMKERSQNVSSSQAKEKRRGKQRAPFVVGNVRENALERLAEDRKDRSPGVRNKLDGVTPDGVEKDKDRVKLRGASSSTFGGSQNGGDSPGGKSNTHVSRRNRALGSGRLSSSELLDDSACCDLPDTPTASTNKSQSSAASKMRDQSSAASMMKGQTPATSMRNSQSPAFSMMKSQSPTLSLTESQLLLKGGKREASHVNLVNLGGNSNTMSDGSRRESGAHKEMLGARRVSRAEQRRIEVERKRTEKEEQRKRLQEKEEKEERMRQELQKEHEHRAEELRLKKVQEQMELQQHEEREKEHVRKEQAEREKEKRRQEEKKRQMERFLKIRRQEEEHRAAELQRLHVEEKERMEEERRKLEEMDEDERQEYLVQRQKEEEERRREAEERNGKEGEAAIIRHEAMLQLARQRAALEQKLKFRRALQAEAGALELAQSVSRPWVYSYYRLLKILGVHDIPPAPEDSADD